MGHYRFYLWLSAVAACLLSAGCIGHDVTVSVDGRRVISRDYVGNGVQWDPYALDYGNGPVDISESDWKKLYDRLDFMKPAFIRVMTNTASVVKDGKLVPETGFGHLSRILDYCQSRGVSVVFGDWGGGMACAEKNTINRGLIRSAAEYLTWLVSEKGYDCIRWYNLVNEPNGWWSSTEGNYDLWRDAAGYFCRCMDETGISGKVSLLAPDAAIWGSEEAWWIDRSTEDIGEYIGLYDIHTYPSKCTVNSGEYTDIIKAYRDRIPEGARIVMGEIGFKFVEKADSLYQKENERRIALASNASEDDSQMFVYDYMYGTDMADALFQTVNAGYSGCVAWMLDDAMHCNESPDKLKIWGFWNIFGEEIFGAEEETVRPWFYSWSLLCRYLPAGSDVYKIDVSGLDGVKAIAASKDGQKTLALVNVSKEPRRVLIKSDGFGKFRNAVRYVYGEGLMKTEGDHILHPDKILRRFDTEKSETVTVPGESMVLFTEQD